MAEKKKSTKKRARKPKAKPRSKPAKGARRSVEDRIAKLRLKLAELERRKELQALRKEPVIRNLRDTRVSLEKAVELLDGRSSKLDAEFIRASRQYLKLLERALDELFGKKRRGRKPSTDLPE